MPRVAWACGVAVAGMLVLEGSASSAPPSVRRASAVLVVHEHPKAACIDETRVREAVAERLGYDPFERPSSAATQVAVTVDASSSSLSADVAVGNAHRALRSPANKCTDLRASIALTLAVLFEEAPPAAPEAAPLATTPSPPSAPAPSPPPVPAVTPGSAPPPSASLPRPEPSPLVATLAATGHAGRLPSPFVGLLVGAGYERGAFSLGVEGTIDPPATKDGITPALFVSGSATAGIYAGSVVPCLRKWLLVACLRASAGILVGKTYGVAGFTGGIEEQSAFHLSFGGRAGLFAPLPVSLAQGLDFAGLLDADIPVLGNSLTLAGVKLWSMSPVGVSLRLGLRLHF